MLPGLVVRYHDFDRLSVFRAYLYPRMRDIKRL